MDKRKTRKRRYLRSRITQNLIINTAEEIFLEKGYAKATITLISKRAKVGYGTVYSHFKGKDDLLNKIIDKNMSGFFELLQDIPPINNSSDFHHTLERKIFENLKAAAENRQILIVFNKALGLSEEVFNHWNHVIEKLIETTLSFAEKAKIKGVISNELDITLATRALCYTIEKFIWEVVYKPETDLKRLSEVLARLYLCGLCGHIPEC